MSQLSPTNRPIYSAPGVQVLAAEEDYNRYCLRGGTVGHLSPNWSSPLLPRDRVVAGLLADCEIAGAPAKTNTIKDFARTKRGISYCVLVREVDYRLNRPAAIWVKSAARQWRTA
jgi:hypothetical protein